jgi:hypothetical protein
MYSRYPSPNINSSLFSGHTFQRFYTNPPVNLIKKNGNPSCFRPSVGAIVFNKGGSLLCGKRRDLPYWQFPQGGIHPEAQNNQAKQRRRGHLNQKIRRPPTDDTTKIR